MLAQSRLCNITMLINIKSSMKKTMCSKVLCSNVSLLGYHIRIMSAEHHNVHTIVIMMPCSLAPSFAVFLPLPLVNSHRGKGIWDGLQHELDCKQCRCHDLGMVLRANVKMLIIGSGQCYDPSS